MRLFLSKMIMPVISGALLVIIIVLSPHSVLSHMAENDTWTPNTNEVPKTVNASISPRLVNCPVPVDLQGISSLANLSQTLKDILVECEAGGPGAQQCSESIGIGPISDSCSTNCRGGYYACCNDSIWSGTSCNCVINPFVK